MNISSAAQHFWPLPYNLGNVPQTKPDPESASPDEIAEWCGITDRASEELVPVDEYREEGAIRCSATGKEPDPPYTIVAKYKVPSGDRRILSNEAYAEQLEAETILSEMQAKVFAYLVAGYSHSKTAEAVGRARGTVASHANSINEKRREARATTTVLEDF